MGKHICTDVSIYANVDKELKCNVVDPEGSLTINYERSRYKLSRNYKFGKLFLCEHSVRNRINGIIMKNLTKRERTLI